MSKYYYKRISNNDGKPLYLLVDADTQTTVGKLDDAYGTAYEQSIVDKLYRKGKISNPNKRFSDFNILSRLSTYEKEDKIHQQQAALDKEFRQYMIDGTKPTSSIGQQLFWAIQQKFPEKLGWKMYPGTIVTDEKFHHAGQVGLIMKNSLTKQTQLIDTYLPTKNSMVNNTHMSFLLEMYRREHPKELVRSIFQYNPNNYSLKKGIYAPEGLSRYYGIKVHSRGFFKSNSLQNHEALINAHLDDSNGFFTKGDPSRKYIKTIVGLDTETEDTKNGSIGRPVEISGKKFGLLPDGRLELIDTFEEYYQGRFGGPASAIHGYDVDIINKLQGLTGQLRGEHYAEGAKQRLLKFIGDSAVVGHNIFNFDFHALRFTQDEINQLAKNGIIDTLQVARNIRGMPSEDELVSLDEELAEALNEQYGTGMHITKSPEAIALKQRAKNDLQSLFREKFGKTTEDMGIRAHGAGGDVTADILWAFQEMADDTEVGKVLRGLLTSRFHLSTHVARSGSAADALGYAYYDERGNEYTAEEIIMMGMIASGGKIGTGGSLMDTNIIGVMQQLEETVRQLAAAVNATTNDWNHANQATEKEYRNLSETIAAGHVGEIRRLATDARKMFPGDYKAQQEYVTNFAGASEPVRLNAMQNLLHLQRIDEKNDFQSRYGIGIEEAKAAGGVWDINHEKTTQRWIPFTTDGNGLWTLGEEPEHIASYSGLFGEIDQIRKEAHDLSEYESNALEFHKAKGMERWAQRAMDMFSTSTTTIPNPAFDDWEMEDDNGWTHFDKYRIRQSGVGRGNNGSYVTWSVTDQDGNILGDVSTPGTAKYTWDPRFALEKFLNAPVTPPSPTQTITTTRTPTDSEQEEFAQALTDYMEFVKGEEQRIADIERSAEMQVGGMFFDDIVKQNSEYMDYVEAQERHIRNMKSEVSLWEEIDEHAVKAAFSTATVIASALIPHAQLSSIPNSLGHQAGSIASSIDWLPFSKKPLHRLAAAIGNNTTAVAAALDYRQEQIDTAANAVTKVGGAIGGGLMVVNPVAGALVSGGSAIAGTLVSGLAGGGWKTKKLSKDITERGQRLSESFNLFGMAFELVRAPFSLLNNTLRGTLNLFTKFNKLMAIFNGMGLPYTSLTGVTFAAYDRTTLTDRGLGLQLGSVNNSLNSWANAQQGLYTMGQMDQNRVIASALLGVFDSVYANGGDTQAQRASTIDKLANDIITDPSRAQSIMTQAGMIDSTMPAELQMAVNMKRAGYISSYSDLGKSSTWGITGASDATKNAWQPRMYAARFGWGSAVQEATFVGRQVATIAWEKLGKPVSNVLIKSGQEIVDAYNTGGWDAMIKKIKELAKEGFKWAKEKLGMDEDASVGDMVSKLWSKVKAAFTTYAAPVFDHIVGLWLGLVKKVGTSLASVIGEMSTWRINTKAILGRALQNEAINPYKDYIDDPILYNEDPNTYNSTDTAQIRGKWRNELWGGLWDNIGKAASRMGVSQSAVRNVIGNSASPEHALVQLGAMMESTSGGTEEWRKMVREWADRENVNPLSLIEAIDAAEAAREKSIQDKQNVANTTKEIIDSLTDFTVQAVNIVKLSINGGPEKTVYIKDGKAYDAETDLEVELTVTNEVNKKASGGGN